MSYAALLATDVRTGTQWVLNGGAVSVQDALSSPIDGKYLTHAVIGGLDKRLQVYVRLATFVLPVGSRVLGLSVFFRASRDGSWDVAFFRESLAETIGSVTRLVGTPTVENVTLPLEYLTLSQADIDELVLAIVNIPNTGDARIEGAEGRVHYLVQPVVAVQLPTGTVTNTSRPPVTWTNTLDEGATYPQTDYEVKVFSAAQFNAVGFNPATSASTQTSGITSSSALTWTPPDPLANDTWRAYVRTAQTVSGVKHWSTFSAFAQFILNVAPPAPPTITSLAQMATASFQVTINAVAGTTTTDELELQRSVDGGVTWVPVRHAGGYGIRIVGTTAIVTDYEAPVGVSVLYRARAAHNYSGIFAESAWTQAAGVTLTITPKSWWLKHPNKPSLNMSLKYAALQTDTREGRQGVFQPLGALLPVVVSDSRLGSSSALKVRVEGVADLAKINAIVDTSATLLMQPPAGSGEPDEYIVVTGQTTDPIVDQRPGNRYDVVLSFVQVALPLGAVS